MPDMNFLHGGNIREVARERREGMIDFSANINPLGLAGGAKEAVCRNLDRVLCYPDPRGRDVIKKVAARWKIDERNILLGNGSAELIYLIMAAYRPKTTLIAVPTFSEYERAAVSVKSNVRFMSLKEEKGFGLNLSHPEPAEITFLCNPNNPTGNLILENGRVPEILSGGLLVIDEAFMDFLPNEDEHTLIRKAVENRKMIVLRTFTKFFAVPGLRIGYLVAHRDVVSELERHQAPWNTNSLAQVAVERSMDDKEYIKRTHELIAGERKFLFAQLAKIRGLRPYPSSANFILIKIENEAMTSEKLKGALIKKGILIRDCSNFRYLGDKFVRIAVRSHEENVKLINALRSAEYSRAPLKVPYFCHSEAPLAPSRVEGQGPKNLIPLKLRRKIEESAQRNKAEGLLFSGGLDSGILAALCPDIKAITVSLGSFGEDIHYAGRIAKDLGLKHFHRKVEIDEAIAAIPEVIKTLRSFDPAIPNDLVVYFGLKLAKELGIKKIMTGDGSDELFAGYSYMRKINDLEAYIGRTSRQMIFNSNRMGEFFGIEISQPFIDEKVVDLSVKIPADLKIKTENGSFHGKWILRKAFEGILPDEVIWQEKRPLERGSGMDQLRRIIEDKVSDEEFRQYSSSMRFFNKEHVYYYKIYRDVVGDISRPKKGNKKCPGCGAGMTPKAFHCRICGHVLDRGKI